MSKALVKSEGKVERPDGDTRARSRTRGKALAMGSSIEQVRFGERLKALRDGLGLSQDKVVENISKVSQKYLSELERGRKTPSWATLLKLARRFDVRVAALLFGIDEELGNDIKSVEELVAGRPPEIRRALLQAFQIVTRAFDAEQAKAPPR